MKLAWLLVLLGCQRSGPVLTTPKQLFDDFTSPTAELLDKYRDGVTFSGVIKTSGHQAPDKTVVWMDVDDDNWLMLELAQPAPPPAALAAGEVLTVTCKIGGASGALMLVTDCVTAL